MVTCIIPTEIHGRWARLVWAGDTKVYQMRTEDVVQLYHYQPSGIKAYDAGMTFCNIKVTTMWKIEVHKSGLHLRAELPHEFNERVKDEPVEEETPHHNIESLGPL